MAVLEYVGAPSKQQLGGSEVSDKRKLVKKGKPLFCLNSHVTLVTC